MDQTITMDRPARSSDPHSSWEAARLNQNSGAKQRQQDAILCALRNFSIISTDPITTAELACSPTCGLDKVAVRKRLPELLNRKLVDKGPQRKCTVAGTLAQTWRIATHA